METVYLNGKFLPKDDAKISPDDRGFLFADGVYEVVRWYEGSFFDIDSHVNRLKRSLGELNINWTEADQFPSVAAGLIKQNNLEKKPVMVYLQVTRGVSKRTHYFPPPETNPTAYAFAFGFIPDVTSQEEGIKVIMKEDIRWSRCDIKSIALLPNTLSFQEAHSKGLKECIFVRDGFFTEGTHSNIFFIINNVLYTHPESSRILSGITRKNVLRMAKECSLIIKEEAVKQDDINIITESFITNTSSEVTPVTEIGGFNIGNGLPGPVTRILQDKFRIVTGALKK